MEFELRTDGVIWWERLADFTKGYIEAMFFADIDTPDHETHGMGLGDLTGDSVARILFDCARFQRRNLELLERAYVTGRDDQGFHLAYTPRQAGADFWFSRVGHGVGYWDRGLGELGDDLHAAAQSTGERNVYLSDDGELEYV